MKTQLRKTLTLASYFLLVAICWTVIRDDLALLFGAPLDQVNGIEFVAALFLSAATVSILISVATGAKS
ncbi:MAG: hypothetical protein V3U03_17345 [Myxococcota bacterium]